MKLMHALWPAGVIAVALASPVQAQDRNYYCGDGQGSIGVRVLSPAQISTFVDMPNSADGAFPMDLTGGGTPSAGYRFSNGEYLMDFSGEGQDVLTYNAPDFGEIVCIWGDDRSGAQPFLFGRATAQVPPQERQVAAPPKEREVAVVADEKAGLPTAGVSCGGKVRSAPDMNSRQVGSLQNGDPITILDYAGEMNGYSWFKIGYGATEGYQWGGILSVADGELPGAYVGC